MDNEILLGYIEEFNTNGITTTGNALIKKWISEYLLGKNAKFTYYMDDNFQYTFIKVE